MLFESCNLQEVSGADDPEDDTDYERETLAARIVDYRWGGEMIFFASGFEFCAAGGQDILDPLAVGAVGEGDEESLGSAEDVYGSTETVAGFSSDVGDYSESWEPCRERGGDAIRHFEVEGCHPARAEAEQERGDQN